MSETPALFSPKSFEDARDEADLTGRWLLVGFTAGWCGPCKNMNLTTWRSPEVEAFVRGKAVAVQVDVDARPELTAQFDVHAMPTLVVLGAGAELDRVLGGQSAAQLLAWLRGLEAGQTSLDAQRARAQGDNLGERFILATDLHARGLDAEAATEALWLWEHALAVDLAFGAVRHTLLAALLEDLVFAVPALQVRLESLRKQAAHGAAEDFRVLSRVLGAS